MRDLLASLRPATDSIVVPAPGTGPGYWSGGPYAVADGADVLLAYRVRHPQDRGRGIANVIARSSDDLAFETVATIPKETFGAASLERPALVRRPDGGWRIYVSCATPGTKHWWVEALDADTVAELPDGRRTMILPGDATEAWKDVVVHIDDDAWHLWACRHPLDCGDAAADRMSSWYFTSPDGLDWTRVGCALAPADHGWDRRGRRITSVVRENDRWWAVYDGRASAEENFHERSGIAVGDSPASFTPVAGPEPAAYGSALRYVSVVEVADGRRVYYEAATPDGSHALFTTLLPGGRAGGHRRGRRGPRPTPVRRPRRA